MQGGQRPMPVGESSHRGGEPAGEGARMKGRVLAALTALTGGTGEVQLLPAGEFRAWDGRPRDVRAWRIAAAEAAAIGADVAARATPVVIDYEHQTLYAKENGQPAPAAGWFRRIEWREGEGLFATGVTWTERARAMIAAGEYRYLSPVFAYDPAGRVTKLLHAALTNTPALDGMAAVAARTEGLDEGEQPMTTETLARLGLAEGATPEQVDQAVAALVASAAAATEQVAALTGQAPDPARYAPVETLQAVQGELAALRAEAAARAVDETVRGALADGRLLPAMESWARELGGKDLAALTGYVEAARPIAALTGNQTGGRSPQGDGTGGDAPRTVALKAQAYQEEQRQKGIAVTTAEAVTHVTKKP